MNAKPSQAKFSLRSARTAPRYAGRFIRWQFQMLFVVGAVPLAAFLVIRVADRLGHPFEHGFRIFIIAWISVMALQFILSIVMGVGRYRLHKALKRASAPPCPGCGYPAVAETSICPECGLSMTTDERKQAWRNAGYQVY